MKSVGFKLTAIMLSIVFIGITVTAGISLYITANVITKETLAKTEFRTQGEAYLINSWITSQQESMNTLSDVVAQMDNADLVKSELQPFLRGILNSHADYGEVYIGFPDNTAIMGSDFAIEELYDTWKASERGWYRQAIANPRTAQVTDPYIDTATGELCISISRAVVKNGAVVGVVGVDIPIPDLKKRVLGINLDNTGYAMLVGGNGDILVHPTHFAPSAAGVFENMKTADNGSVSAVWSEISSTDGAYNVYALGEEKYFTSSTVESTGWHLVTVLPASVISQSVKEVIMIVILLAIAIIIAACLFISLSIRNTISTPLVAIASFMHKAGSTGDLSLRPEDIENNKKLSGRNDELAKLSSGTTAFLNHISETSAALKSVANGDLTTSVSPLSDKDEMGSSLKTMIDTLNKIFAEINASAKQVSIGSKQIADGAQSLARGASQQAESVTDLSGSISEITQKTKDNAQTAEKTSTLSETIKENAVRGSQRMEEMTEAVKEINEASQSIGKVIKTIDDIAFQTNILALNAAVEAARAGQHGKGFAVVAEEVRNLAAKSAEAAKETGDMIQNSKEKAELGSRIAADTAYSFTEIVSGINDSNMLISEIAQASDKQTIGMQQLNMGMDQVSQVVTQNSATAEESAAASEELSSQSDILEQLISQFKLKEV